MMWEGKRDSSGSKKRGSVVDSFMEINICVSQIAGNFLSG